MNQRSLATVSAVMSGVVCTLIVCTGLRAQVVMDVGGLDSWAVCDNVGRCPGKLTPCVGNECIICEHTRMEDDCFFNLFADCQPQMYVAPYDCGVRQLGTCPAGVCVPTGFWGTCPRFTCQTL